MPYSFVFEYLKRGDSMAVTMPTIEVVFKQLAGSLIERSERGIAILIVKDDTDQSFSYKSYSDITQLDEDKEKYTDNLL